MKSPTAKQLPSGSWYCRIRVGGQDVSITRPTKNEAVADAMAVKVGAKVIAHEPRRQNLAVYQAMDNYISARENVLSPATVRGYRTIQKNRFVSARNMKISSLTQAKWQQIVNLEARTCSPKTLKNAWGFLSSVIFEATGNRVSVRLPQVVVEDRPFLTPEQIPVFVQAVKGTDIEIAALLGLSSLRRSEILALRWENIDLKNNVIHIKGAAVVGPDGKLVQKATNKNKKSRRTVPIIEPLKEALGQVPQKTGIVVNVAPCTIYTQVNNICRENHLPEVGVHGLRRSFASLAYHLGFSEEMTMQIGGWSDIYTMRKIYTELSEKDISEKSSEFTDFFKVEKD